MIPAPLIALIFNKYTFGALAAVAVAAGLYYGISHAWNKYVAEPYRAEGRAQEAKRLQPVIEAQTKRLEADIAAFQQVEKAYIELNANSERLKKLAAQAQKVKIVRQVEEKERIVYLDSIVPSGETECHRMDDVISRALR